jgi:hypothetical protein
VIEQMDARGNKHRKTISHATKSGISVCYTAPRAWYKNYLQKHTDLSRDDRNLVACLSITDIRLPEGVKKADDHRNVLDPVQEQLVGKVTGPKKRPVQLVDWTVPRARLRPDNQTLIVKVLFLI